MNQGNHTPKSTKQIRVDEFPLPACPFHKSGCESAMHLKHDKHLGDTYQMVWDCGSMGPVEYVRTEAIASAARVRKTLTLIEMSQEASSLVKVVEELSRLLRKMVSAKTYEHRVRAKRAAIEFLRISKIPMTGEDPE